MRGFGPGGVVSKTVTWTGRYKVFHLRGKAVMITGNGFICFFSTL